MLGLGTAIILMGSVMLASCGSGDEQTEAAMRISVCSNYVGEEQLQAFSDGLFAAHSDWMAGETPVTVEAINMGSEDLDGAAYGAAIMQVSARVVSKELDIMICGGQDASRNARSDMFYALDEIFTEDEIAQFGDRLLAYEKVDTDGNPTGELTPVCGVRLSSEALDAIYGAGEYGIFIVGNTTHLEQAKEVFLALAGE